MILNPKKLRVLVLLEQAEDVGLHARNISSVSTLDSGECDSPFDNLLTPPSLINRTVFLYLSRNKWRIWKRDMEESVGKLEGEERREEESS